jgi:hypothetical protein
MPKPKKQITFGQVIELPTGTREAPVWVDEFDAVVSNVRNGHGWSDCTLADPSGGGRVIAAAAQDRDMSQYSGKVCRFSGSMSKSEYQDRPKISIFKKCVITVQGEGPSGDRSPQPSQSRPQAAAPAPTGRPGDTHEFHREMKKMSLLYCHCMDYAAAIDHRTPFHTPEQMQACVSTLFIAADRRNLLGVVPPRGDVPGPAAKPAPTPEPPPQPQGPEEDVPF